jgi:hypothetical protein
MTMGIDETGNPDGTEGAGSSGLEDTGGASGDNDMRAERAGPRETGDPGDTGGERAPAETRTREEYADDMRAQDSPIPPGGDPADDNAPADEPDTPPGEPANDTAVEDRAEPRDRETYADDVRADTGTPELESADSADNQATAAFDPPAETGTGEPGRQPAEPLSRDEYADTMRESSFDNDQPDLATPSNGDTLTGAEAEQASGETGAAEPLEDGPTAEDASPHPGENRDTAPDPPTRTSGIETAAASTMAERPADETSRPTEGPDAAAGENDASSEHPPSTQGDASEISTAHSDSQDMAEAGNQDELTANDQAASDGEQVVDHGSTLGIQDTEAVERQAPQSLDEQPGSSQERADNQRGKGEPVESQNATSADRSGPGHDQAANSPAPDLRAAETRTEKVYVDGKEIEITHKPADGIWVGGLPGEAPDRIGDALVGPEDDKRTRSDRFFHRAVEKGDDLLDSIEKNVNLGADAMRRPPTHAEIPVQGAHHVREVHHHELDAGSVATAGLAVGVLAWAGGRWIHRRLRDVGE